MANLINGRKVIDALIEAGIADENTVRVVLDVPVTGFVRAYVLKVGDDRVLDVIKTMTGDAVVLVQATEEMESGK